MAACPAGVHRATTTRFAAARCTLTWHARACGLGLHARVRHRPEQLQVAGRATDDARTAHADLGARHVAVPLGPRVTRCSLQLQASNGIVAEDCTHHTVVVTGRGQWGQVGIGACAFAVRRGTGGDTPNRVRTWAWAGPVPWPGAEPHMRRPRMAMALAGTSARGRRDNQPGGGGALCVTPRYTTIDSVVVLEKEWWTVERDWRSGIHPCMHESDRGMSDLMT